MWGIGYTDYKGVFELSDSSQNMPDFSAREGLVAAIAQDAETGEVLMLAYMNQESFEETLATGRAVYYSRSRKRLWRKGKRAATCKRSVQSISIAMPIRSCSKCGKSAAPRAMRGIGAAFSAS